MDAKFHHRHVEVPSRGCLEFVDLTDQIKTILKDSGITNGLLNVQTRHTTASIVVNENEPRLLQDMKRVLESLAPQSGKYLHNDLHLRRPPAAPEEDQNGHSHCKALFLKSSEILNVVNGELQLGCWQRVFLLELDKPRTRVISIMVLGV